MTYLDIICRDCGWSWITDYLSEPWCQNCGSDDLRVDEREMADEEWYEEEPV